MEAHATVYEFSSEMSEATARSNGNETSERTSSNVKTPVRHSEAKSSAAWVRYLSHTESSPEFPSASTNSCLSEWSPLKRIWLALEGEQEY